MICRCNRVDLTDCGCQVPCVFSEAEVEDAFSKSTICPFGNDDNSFIESNRNSEFLLLVAGSRTFEDYDIFSSKMDIALSKKKPDDVIIISVEEKGTGLMAKRYAQEQHISFIGFPVTRSKREQYAVLHEYLSSVAVNQRGCLLFGCEKDEIIRQNYELAKRFGTLVKSVKMVASIY